MKAHYLRVAILVALFGMWASSFTADGHLSNEMTPPATSTDTPTATHTPHPTPAFTDTPTPTATDTPKPTPVLTDTPTPSATPTPHRDYLPVVMKELG